MPLDNKIIDLNIEGSKRTQFRINGNDKKMLELDLSDLGIADRLEKGYVQLKDVIQEITDYDGDSAGAFLKEEDEKMRKIMDYIFDSDVSELCCPYGTMFDLVNGKYKFEIILDTLTKLYETNLNDEYKLMKKRIEDKTSKYLPQDHKPKSKSVKRREEIQKGEDE